MKTLLASVLLCAAVLPAFAQDAEVEARESQERDRIKAERATAEERFRIQEHACRQKFAVNDCVDRARRTRAAAVADLRRQELLLNEAGRKREAAQRRKELDDRSSELRQRQAAEKRERALKETEERERRFEEKAARRAADQASQAAHPREPREPRPGTVEPQGKARAARAFQAPQPEASKAAENRARFEANQKEAAAHKAAVQERAAKRAKPAASALPVPAD